MQAVMARRPEVSQLVVGLTFPRLVLSHLEHVRTFMGFLLSPPHEVGADLLSDLTVSTHELMENAIKYTRDRHATLELRVDPARADRLLVRTRNRASARDAGRARALVGRLAAADPRAVYQQVLAETAHRTHGSGLGLVRIAAECGMTLSTRYRGGRLIIDAWSTPGRTR